MSWADDADNTGHGETRPMSFLENLSRAKAHLREHGRVSLRALKREFDLDDEALEELVEELVDLQQVATREGQVLTWVADRALL